MSWTNDPWSTGDEFDDAIRGEAAGVEADVEAARLRSRTLPEAVAELGARGDKVSVSCGGTSLIGVLASVAGDLGILSAGDTEGSLNLDGPLVIALVEESRTGGTPSRGGSRSFRARLSEFELSGEPVTVFGPFFSEDGVIGSVAAEHVVLDRGSGEMYLPIRLIGFVTRPTPRAGAAD